MTKNTFQGVKCYWIDMYFFTITDLSGIAFYNALSKRLPPGTAKIEPVSFIELGKEWGSFQPSSKIYCMPTAITMY